MRTFYDAKTDQIHVKDAHMILHFFKNFCDDTQNNIYKKKKNRIVGPKTFWENARDTMMANQ